MYEYNRIGIFCRVYATDVAEGASQFSTEEKSTDVSLEKTAFSHSATPFIK